MRHIPSFWQFARLFALGALLALGARANGQTDPLPSWNDGPARQAIVTFVQETTDPASPKFVPPAERIATFDQDGARLAMLALHDDAQREYAYDPAQGLPDTRVGTFTQALYEEAKKQGWTVISMKRDWKGIFAFAL
jgi:hypothetical protein